MADPLSPRVKLFIHRHIHGITQLEVLLYLHDNPRAFLTPAIAARELRLGEEQAAGLLHDLHARGLLAMVDGEVPDCYRYEPRTRELARQVAAVAKIYPTYRHRIIQLIFSKPPEGITNFSQAFRLRKDDDD